MSSVNDARRASLSLRVFVHTTLPSPKTTLMNPQVSHHFTIQLVVGPGRKRAAAHLCRSCLSAPAWPKSMPPHHSNRANSRHPGENAIEPVMLRNEAHRPCLSAFLGQIALIFDTSSLPQPSMHFGAPSAEHRSALILEQQS
eukprot:2281759-Amphidinium_carterae.1